MSILYLSYFASYSKKPLYFYGLKMRTVRG